MSDAVQIDVNALLLTNADLTYKSGLKLVVSKVVAVCTSNFLFAIPVKVTAVRVTGGAKQTEGDADAAAAVRAAVNKPGQTIEGLEAELLAISQGHDNAVLKFSDLSACKLKGWGPFRQLSLKRQGSVMPMSFVPRGKGEMKRFEAFFSQRVPAASS